jgi:hypothetical protein
MIGLLTSFVHAVLFCLCFASHSVEHSTLFLPVFLYFSGRTLHIVPVISIMVSCS